MIFSSDKAVCAGAPAAIEVAEPAIHAAKKIAHEKFFIDDCLMEF
jgi:hypothetical protein